jgi:hypothetical protein
MYRGYWKREMQKMILDGKRYGTRIFARPRHRWAGNIKANIKETVYVLNGL